VLILDEPANGLDPAGMAELRELLRELAAEGRTVLMSSHVLSEVAQTVDRVVVIADGTLRWSGPLAELTGPGISAGSDGSAGSAGSPGSAGETLEAAFLRLTAASGRS